MSTERGTYNTCRWTRGLMIIWLLDLQLPVQSVPITTKVVSSNPVHGEVYSVCQFEPRSWRGVLSLSVTCDRFMVYCGFLHQ